jgi:hypothetical protein
LFEGVSILNSFSNIGSHGVTKCKFFKHTHSPFYAAYLIVSIAISFYPPPIAIS